MNIKTTSIAALALALSINAHAQKAAPAKTVKAVKEGLKADAVSVITTQAPATVTNVALTTKAQELKTPADSPTQTVKQDFALSNIEITYARPSAKGRKIFGGLVPYGEVWRTGANNATTITFGDDVKVGGQNVPAGKYALYTIPGETEWEIILNKDTDNWGSDGYKKEDDVVRFKTPIHKIPSPMLETLTIAVDNVQPSSANIAIFWADVMASFPVTADIDGKIMANIDEAMKSDKKPYYTAAKYYFDNGKDLNKALSWMDAAIAEKPDTFFMPTLKAKIQYGLKDFKGAIKTAELAKSLAIGKNPAYVEFNSKLVAEATQAMKK